MLQVDVVVVADHHQGATPELVEVARDVVRGLADHGTDRGFSALTGGWPG